MQGRHQIPPPRRQESSEHLAMTVHAKAVESINADTFIGFLKELRQIHKKIHHVPWEPFCAQVASIQVRQVQREMLFWRTCPSIPRILTPWRSSGGWCPITCLPNESPGMPRNLPSQSELWWMPAISGQSGRWIA